MSVLYLVVPLAIVVVLVARAGFTWAARQGQFDDLDTPALRMLNDDAPAKRMLDDDAPAKRPRGGASDREG